MLGAAVGVKRRTFELRYVGTSCDQWTIALTSRGGKCTMLDISGGGRRPAAGIKSTKVTRLRVHQAYFLKNSHSSCVALA